MTDLPIDPQLPILDEIEIDTSSNKRTARTATRLIMRELKNCYEPSNEERSAICVAFARKGKPVYGKAFDLFQMTAQHPRSAAGIELAIQHGELRLLEVKSTGRARIDEEFSGYFFSLSTAELLVAQALGDLYQFAFYNTTTKTLRMHPLNEIYKKAKGVYPTWSIRF
ncbi:hypothetical protein [Deinococcus radiotolerans]|uniref:Protein NO VEIN C-terminal domain-containing protein n=1 Tax=Deinococcus radiotolerans TaxID=1309407 RepID=A0ABQ2FKR7_9DEIO|nr:hypothetical protein [Deinococcus radiotolerans]GGL07684.1 hypothetical protein GCM10010844_28030 [Deinococcus radiotolerans]